MDAYQLQAAHDAARELQALLAIAGATLAVGIYQTVRVWRATRHHFRWPK